jgi:ComF family protein
VAIEAGDLGLSPGVRERIARGIAFPYCARCGMGTGPYTRNDAKARCGQCAGRSIGVASIARVGTFDPPLSDLVKRLKFQKRWEIAAIMAPFMVQAIEMQAATYGLKVDALVPVALHWRRRFSRGFNQAEELARAMGRIAGWEVVGALKRVRATHEQSLTQSVHQRRENLESAFVAREIKGFAGKHFWLIDDVCTTGATIRAAALAFRRLPKELRPARLHAAVVCVTDRTPLPADKAGVYGYSLLPRP